MHSSQKTLQQLPVYRHKKSKAGTYAEAAKREVGDSGTFSSLIEGFLGSPEFDKLAEKNLGVMAMSWISSPKTRKRNECLTQISLFQDCHSEFPLKAMNSGLKSSGLNMKRSGR